MKRTVKRKETKAQRSAVMAKVRSKNTGPEMAVRRFIHGLGYRYRLHDPRLPGKPDLVFRPRKKVVFAHGCFWHGHHCRAGQNRPASNRNYWDGKLGRNMERDKEHQKSLKKMGWKSLTLWECQTKNLASHRSRILRFLEGK